MRCKAVGFAVSLSLFGAIVGLSGDAQASSAAVSGTGKGIAGGALLGGEIGFMGLSAFGAKSTWMYWTIPPLLAAGGGVAGYFIEKSATPEIPMYMLAGGMALLIPTVVITLSANAYQPASEDSTPSDAAPAADAGKAGVKVDAGATSTTPGSPSAPTPATGASPGGPAPATGPGTGPSKHKPSPTSMRPARPFALVNYDGLGSLQLALPVVQVTPAFSQVEVAKYGLTQRYELHAPMVSVAW